MEKFRKGSKEKDLNHQGQEINLIALVREKYRKVKTLNDISKRLEKDPKEAFTLNPLGIYHLLRNERGVAQIAFERALETDNGRIAIHRNLAILSIKEKDFERARLLLTRRILSSVQK